MISPHKPDLSFRLSDTEVALDFSTVFKEVLILSQNRLNGRNYNEA